jgi:hypothetical protein
VHRHHAHSTAPAAAAAAATAPHHMHGHVPHTACFFGCKGRGIYWLAIHCNHANLNVGGLRHRSTNKTRQAPLFQEVPSTRTKNSGGVAPPHPLGVLQPVAQLHAAHTRLTSSAAPIKESNIACKCIMMKNGRFQMHSEEKHCVAMAGVSMRHTEIGTLPSLHRTH